MNDQNNREGFTYTYSAKEQDEVKRIREKYAMKPQTQDKMEQLRSLDAGVTQKATVISLVFGILGTLLLGIGMSIAMTEFGNLLGDYAMLIGIILGVLGIALIAMAYPVYMRVVKRERERIAPEILRLTDELMK